MQTEDIKFIPYSTQSVKTLREMGMKVMRKIPHIVLTRFNLAIKFDCAKRFDSHVPLECPWLNEKYLEERFRIFEEYTYPSFLRQTDKEFRWIVMFHKDTPSCYRERIKKLEEKMEQFEAWFLDDEQCCSFGRVINEYIEKNYPEGGIITTRVDNDDIVHKSFIGSIKKELSESKEAAILSFVNGLQYDSRSGDIMKYHYANNHFLSLYVPDTKGKNHILLYNHDKIDNCQINKVERNTTIPLWVEMITETNFSNTPRWRFLALAVPFKVKEEYPTLSLNWNTRPEYLGCLAIGVGKVFKNRTLGLIRMLRGR